MASTPEPAEPTTTPVSASAKRNFKEALKDANDANGGSAINLRRAFQALDRCINYVENP